MLKKAKAESRPARRRGRRRRRSRCSTRRGRSGSQGSARSRARKPKGMKMFEALVKQGEALEARTRQGGVGHGGCRARRREGARRRRCRRWRAERGTSWSRCSRSVSRARSRSSASTRRATWSGWPQRVDALSEAVNELIKARARAARRRRPGSETGSASAPRRAPLRSRRCQGKPPRGRTSSPRRVVEPSLEENLPHGGLSCADRGGSSASPRRIPAMR